MNVSIKNQKLFSDHYLEKLLPNQVEWYGVSERDVLPFLSKIKELYKRYKNNIEEWDENTLEDRFIRPILKILGHHYKPQMQIPGLGRETKYIDYGFFDSDELADNGDYKQAIAIGEAKRYGRPLDKKLKIESEKEAIFPASQMKLYFLLSEIPWGILTDGRYWRLYERETSKRLDVFYQVDLFDLLNKGTTEQFKYFYLFFRKNAFPDFLKKVRIGSADYAKEVGDELKGNVYKALGKLANGFLHTINNNLTYDDIDDIHDNCLIYLYRLLFVLFAEARNLLPLEKEQYKRGCSLHSIKNDIQKDIDTKKLILHIETKYSQKLKDLFYLVNSGSESLGFDPKDMYIPPYNGGLFDTQKYPFLEKYKVADIWLKDVIDLLARSKNKNNNGKSFIDYSSLQIRHLGSIYEGLLEYKLKLADENMVPVKVKGKEIFIPQTQADNENKRYDDDDVVKKGDLYLATDKGERKATGSYYTPDYIVEYIVKNTLEPIIEEKKKSPDFIDEIQKIKVLDPAMGSGHFLVEATDFLARELLESLSGESKSKDVDEDDLTWAKREIVEKCIYGVDLNPLAVELAKLALWLNTVSLNKPLSFLDHHLKCGNSLIGANIRDLSSYPILKNKNNQEHKQLGVFETIFNEKIVLLLREFAFIEKNPSDTVLQIKEKEAHYQSFRKIISRFEDFADIWTSILLDNNVNQDNYQSLLDNIRTSDAEWDNFKNEEWFNKAKSLALENNFFHWEIEFPEIFYEGKHRKDNPGFDAVIGNPPYIFARGKSFEDWIKKYFYGNYRLANYQLNTYLLLIEQGYILLQQSGYFGFIVPNNWLTIDTFAPLRKFLIEEVGILQVINIHDKVFSEANVDTSLLIFKKVKPNDITLGEFQDGKLKIVGKFAPEIFKSNNNIINISLSKSKDKMMILKMLIEKSKPLIEYASISTGLKAYQTGKGKPIQNDEIKNNRVYHSVEKKMKVISNILKVVMSSVMPLVGQVNIYLMVIG